MLPEIDVIPRREPGFIMEDNFNNGPSGWTQLMDGTKPTGPIVLDSEITFDNSRYSLLLMTDEHPDTATRTWGQCMALKRLSRPATASKVYCDLRFGWGTLHGDETPRAMEWGIDQADANGLRSYFLVRWQNYDQASATRTSQWQVLHNDVYTDIPGAVIDCGYNENKRNLNRVEMVFDLAEGCYDGLRVNGQGFGSLAETPDDSLRAYTPTPHTLGPFANGLNLTAAIRNRTDTVNTQSWMNLAYAKVVAL